MQYKFNYLFSWPLSLEHQSRPLCQTVGLLEYSSERRTQSPSLETYRKDLAIGSLPLAPADNRDAWSHLNNEWKWSSIYGQLLWFRSQLCTGVFFSISKILIAFFCFSFSKKIINWNLKMLQNIWRDFLDRFWVFRLFNPTQYTCVHVTFWDAQLYSITVHVFSILRINLILMYTCMHN